MSVHSHVTSAPPCASPSPQEIKRNDRVRIDWPAEHGFPADTDHGQVGVVTGVHEHSAYASVYLSKRDSADWFPVGRLVLIDRPTEDRLVSP